MSIKEMLDSFNERWDIPNSTYNEELSKFKKRILNSLKGIEYELVEDDVKGICNVLGIDYKGQLYEDIYLALKNETTEKHFYKILQVLAIFPIQPRYNRSYSIAFKREDLLLKIISAIKMSDINLTYVVEGDAVLLYPKGEKKLDDKLVNGTLSYLNPESSSHFIDSLKFFGETKGIKSAESLRRTLEEYLRFKLNNTKGLDNNISELNVRLKKDKRDPEIRRVIFQTFNFLDKYFNDNSKHNDGDIDEIENEYLIYQVGLLLRYISKISLPN